MAQDECCEVTQEKQEKHAGLSMAIESIDALLDRLDLLIDRISGPTPEKPEVGREPKETEPTLSDVLCSGEERIQKKMSAAHEKVGDINNLLF